MRSMEKQITNQDLNNAPILLIVTRCQQPCQTSQGPFRIASCSQLEVGIFPTIVDSLAVEVMSVEVFG